MEGRISKLFRSGLSMLLVVCMVVAICPAVFAATEDNNTETVDTSALVSFGYDMLGYLPEDISAAFDKLVEMVKAKDPAAAEELIQYAKENGYFEAVKKALNKLDADSVTKAVATVKDIIANADEIIAALKNELLTLDETLKDLKSKLEETKAELEKIQNDLEEAKAELDDAAAKLEQAEKDLEEAKSKGVDTAEEEAKLADAKKQYEDALAQYEEAAPQLENAIAALDEAIAKLDTAIAQVEEQMPRVEAGVAKLEAYVASLKAAVEIMKSEGFVEGVREAQPVVNDMLADAEELVAFVSEDTAAKLSEKIAEIKTKLDELYTEANERYFNVITGEYEITADSYYVALGDGSAYGESYVNVLADELAAIYGADYAFKNLSAEGMPVEDIFDVLADNRAEIEKADLITIGFGNDSLTEFVVDQMTKLFANKPVDIDWTAFVNEEGQARIEEARTKLYEELTAKGFVGEYQGVDMATALAAILESYAYSYASYIYYLPKALEEIQAINPDAKIVVVGTYNLLDGVSLVMNERKVDMDRYMDYVVEATDLSTLAVSMLNNNVTFVDAPEVETLNTESEMTALGFVANFNTGYLLPSANGHAYIAQQILDTLTITTDTTCVHNWQWITVLYPSCASSGMQVYKCSLCGEVSDSRVIAPNGHAYSNWEVTKEATCTEAGEETRSCFVCGASESREIEATGHTFGEWTVTKEATCTEKGEETRECECGETETREIEALGHTFGEWTETKAATCTEAGEETSTCSVCGETETREIEATGHKFGAWVLTKGATCTEPGEGTRTCSNCGAAETREIRANGHVFGEWTETKAATCTEAGVETRTCACGEAETREIPATGVHTFGDWTVTKEPTTEAEGEETRTCSGCGLTETRAIEKLPPAEKKNNLWWILLIVAGVGGAGTGGYFYLKKKQIF